MSKRYGIYPKPSDNIVGSFMGTWSGPSPESGGGSIPPPTMWYKLNDSGTSFADSSGNGYTMFNQAGTNFPTALPGWAVTGTTWSNSSRNAQLASYVAALDFGATQSWTASAWVNITQGGAVITNLDVPNGYPGWVFYASAYPTANEISIQVVGTSSSQITVTSNTGGSMTFSSTHFIAATYNGSGHASGVKLYIDGVQVATIATTDALVPPVTSTAPVGIGSLPNYPTVQNMLGIECDIRVWKSVLSPTQIAKLFTNGPQ
jgi:hypothetical protein